MTPTTSRRLQLKSSDEGRRRRRGEGTGQEGAGGQDHSSGARGGTGPHEDAEGGAAVLHVPESQSICVAGLEAAPRSRGRRTRPVARERATCRQKKPAKKSSSWFGSKAKKKPKKKKEAFGSPLCGNQPVCRVHRQFFPKSFLGDDTAVLAPSSGEEPRPRHRAGVASMAWRSTRRCSTNAP